jgi:hypothetical protein
MCVYKSAKNDNSIRETNRQQCYIHPEREKKKLEIVANKNQNHIISRTYINVRKDAHLPVFAY